jgi:hypothetical protein
VSKAGEGRDFSQVHWKGSQHIRLLVLVSDDEVSFCLFLLNTYINLLIKCIDEKPSRSTIHMWNSAMYQGMGQKLFKRSVKIWLWNKIKVYKALWLGFSLSLVWLNNYLDEINWIFTNYLCSKVTHSWEHAIWSQGWKGEAKKSYWTVIMFQVLGLELYMHYLI